MAFFFTNVVAIYRALGALFGRVMETALQHIYQVGLEAVDEPVLPTNATRPEPGKIVFEGFCFTRARARTSDRDTHTFFE